MGGRKERRGRKERIGKKEAWGPWVQFPALGPNSSFLPILTLGDKGMAQIIEFLPPAWLEFWL